MDRLWLIAIVVGVLAIWFALKIAREARKAAEREKERTGRSEDDVAGSWFGTAFGHWGTIAAAFGGLKYIYKEWKTAPPGSLEQFGWGSLLVLIIALALFLLLKMVERKLNGSVELPDRESVDPSVDR